MYYCKKKINYNSSIYDSWTHTCRCTVCAYNSEQLIATPSIHLISLSLSSTSCHVGLDTQGLYRISSAKSKMEKLCQLFESGSERVDLSDLPPHLISSCLKLYFRQVSPPIQLLINATFYRDDLSLYEY